VLDWEDVDRGVSGPGGVPAKRVDAHHGAGFGRVRIGHHCGKAVEHAPAVVRPVEDGARGNDLVRHPLVGDQDDAALGERRAELGEDRDWLRQVVQRLEDRHQVIPSGRVELRHVTGQEGHPVT